MRKGLLRDLKGVFDDAKIMVRGGDPEDFDSEDERLDKLREEVLGALQEGEAARKLLVDVFLGELLKALERAGRAGGRPTPKDAPQPPQKPGKGHPVTRAAGRSRRGRCRRAASG